MAHTHHSHDHHNHAHHGHAHHHHNHHQGVTTINAAFAIAVGCNLLFTIIEAFFSFQAHSMGLLADAGHNFGDVLGLLMAWGATWMAKRSATEKYSYGYKKTTILAALGNALLLVLATAFIVYESIAKLLNPVPINELTVIVVALIGIGVNGGTALLFVKSQEEDLNIKGAFLHLAYDALISVGVVIAGVTIYFTGWLWLDPVAGLLIVAIISMGSWNLLRRSIDLIIGAVPHGIDQQAVRDYLSQIPGVTAIHDLHIWGLSTQETALTAHLVMPEGHLSDEDYQHINHHLKHDFKINHVTLQIEKGHTDFPCEQESVC